MIESTNSVYNSNLSEQKRERALQDVKLWLANDWNLKEETPEYFLLTRRKQSIGLHIVIFFFTFWFSLGIFNLLYFLLSKKSKKIIK